MNLWLARAGSRGEYEQKFLDEGRIYVTWSGLDVNLKEMEDRSGIMEALARYDTDAKKAKLRNHTSQLWPFAHSMQVGDWVVLPSKSNPVVHFAKITGDYHFEPAGPDPFFHYRTVDWFATEVPRSHFSQDILYSLGAFLTICRIQRNNAFERIQAMAANEWRPETGRMVVSGENGASTDEDILDNDQPVDLEYAAKQQVVRNWGQALHATFLRD